MAPASLGVNLSALPLILAGPMVRHTRAEHVTVWVALREPRAVTLRVYLQDSDEQPVMEAVARTMRLGANLHVVAVTAGLKPPHAPLAWGAMAFYDLFFDVRPDDDAPLDPAAPASPNLQQPDILVVGDPAAMPLVDRLLYPTFDQNGMPTATPRFGRPSFVLPQADVSTLRLIHASCRKPHGEGRDMLALLDTLLAPVIDDPVQRPQQLLLTGDQIYADDVADALLAYIGVVEKLLLGWQEELPGIPSSSGNLKPGHRQELVEEQAAFTSSEAYSHLLTFGEFCTMYLLVWSPVLWPSADLPALQFEDFFPGEDAHHFDFWGLQNRTDLKERFDSQKPQVDHFLSSLKEVRRALAHISTYMIFDDHEITDDWFLNLDWCLDVLDTALGRRVINNGLMAFALFQAWGNTPERFEPGTPGASLLDVAAEWSSKHKEQTDLLPQLGLPIRADLRSSGDLWPAPAALPNVLRFDYVVDGPPVAEVEDGQLRQKALSYRMFFLNPRTGRTFATDDWIFNTTPPALVGRAGFDSQLNPSAMPEHEKCELAIVVSPAPVVGVPWVETIQGFFSFWGAKAFADYESWGLQETAVQNLFSRIARLGRTRQTSGPTPSKVLSTRAIVLCGDVHYGFGARIGYGNAASTPRVEATIAQFTASSLKNQTSGGLFDLGKTLLVHNVGYAFWGDFLPTPDGEKVDARIDKDACYQPAFVRMTAGPPSPPPGALPNTALGKFTAAAQKHQFYGDEWANGKEVVGYNNLGEIRLDVDADGHYTAEQILYWRPGQTLLKTLYRVSLQFDAPACS